MATVEYSIWQAALQYPDKTAVMMGKDIATYRQLCCRILAARNFFVENLLPGNSIILSSNKQIEFVYAYFGAHLASLKVVPLDPAISPIRLNHILQLTEAKFVIGFEQQYNGVNSIPLSHIALHKEPDFTIPDFPMEDAVSDILFTTGTTGQPKGVPLTFRNEAATVENINEFIGNNPDDIELLALPISHSFGLGRIRCCLAKGSTLIVLGSFVNVKKLFRTMEEQHVTGFSMVPASWRYLKKFSGNKLSEYAAQLRYVEMGSAFLSNDEKKELAGLLPHTKLCMHYGLTEASRSAFLDFHQDFAHLDSIGKPLTGIEIEVFDENGCILPSGIEGELCIKGNHVMNGYLKKQGNDEFFGAFLRTGDWGYKDNEGYIYLKSRKKELINTGGKKVSPFEVEEELNQIDGISDSACVGVPDPNGILGEIVKAFVVKAPNTEITFEEISSQLRVRLEAYKIPAQYEWIDKIPQTQNGKKQRLLLL